MPLSVIRSWCLVVRCPTSAVVSRCGFRCGSFSRLYLFRLCLSLAICLASGFHRVANLFLLRGHNFLAAIHPLVRLGLVLLRAVLHIIGAFLGITSDVVARLLARLRSIQNSHRCADAEPRQKPQNSTAAVVSHKDLLNVFQASDGSTGTQAGQLEPRALTAESTSTKINSSVVSRKFAVRGAPASRAAVAR